MLLAFEGGVLLLGVVLIAAPKLGAPSHHHGAVLGAAAGFLFGLSDVVTKAVTHVDGGPLAMSSRRGCCSRRSAACWPSCPRRVAFRRATPSR
jgi:drug/metabolite transporter (DMT)-like permease